MGYFQIFSLTNCALFPQLLIFNLCMCISALHDDNTLTIDVNTPQQSEIDDSQQWNTFSPDDVRCYCNLPICVSTSYMCKSEEGSCFSEVTDIGAEHPPGGKIQQGRHGCLELITDRDQRAQCRNMPTGRGSYRGHPRSLLLCCFKDLCNHVDSPETHALLNSTRLISGSTMNDSRNHPSISSSQMNMSLSPGYNSNEVWFKAAIIAVPICGVVILLLLIFLAVKMLKTDILNTSNKLGDAYSHNSERKSNRDHFEQIHHQPGMNSKKIPLLIHHHHHDLSSGACTNHSSDELLKHTTVPLLVQNETGKMYSHDKKNEANAKMNKENNSPLMGLHKTLNTTSNSNNMYRNVNLSLTPVQSKPHPNMGEKLYEKQVLNAVITWGGPSPSSSPV